MKQIVILGAGGGGTMVANNLANDLSSEIKQGKITIHVVGESDKHVFQPAHLDIAFKGANPSSAIHSETTLLDKKVQFTTDAAEKIDLGERKIRTRRGNEITYDYLVLATGAAAVPGAMEGLKEGSLNFHTDPFEAAKIWDSLQHFKSGKVLIAITSVPHKCPPSPDEAAFMVDEFFRKKGIRNSVEIKFLTPYPRAYPTQSISDVVQPMFEERKIEMIPYFNADRCDPAAKKIYSLEGEGHDYDLLIAIPPHRGTEVILSSAIGDEEGWIPADKQTMKVKDQSDTYALGDATNIAISKSGVVAHLQAGAVAKSIESDVTGTASEDYGYNGRINCPMETGHHKALFVSGTFETPPARNNPTFVKYVMKKSFGKMYWSALRGSWDWLFDIYFGKTSKPVGKDVVVEKVVPLSHKANTQQKLSQTT